MDSSFHPLLYGCFLFAVFSVYWLLPRTPRGQAKLAFLLVVSLIFYATLPQQLAYVPLLLAGVLVNFVLGFAIGPQEPPEDAKLKISKREVPGSDSAYVLAAPSQELRQRAYRRWQGWRASVLALGIAINVLLLLGFKYAPFLFEYAVGWFPAIATPERATWLAENLVFPLGISFFSFECISYLVDVYRGKAFCSSWLDFATYKLFFPKLIAGPICRYGELKEQFDRVGDRPKAEDIAEGLWLVATGALKKGLVADRLAVFVNLSLENNQRASSLDLWLVVLAYGFQLYLDFSGYIDIARGSALLLGFRLPINFDFPYLAANIASFWRRWHVTLGSWVRDYLYIPLGGSRRGLPIACINLFVVMLLVGLWHGRAGIDRDPAGYLIWGAIHGVALVVHRINAAAGDRWRPWQFLWTSWPGVLLSWTLTQTTVFLSWMFFRLPDWREARWVLQHLWSHTGDPQFASKIYESALGIDRPILAAVLAGLFGWMAIAYAIDRGLKIRLNWPVKIALAPLCLYAVWMFAPAEGLPPIYFDF